VHLQLQLTYDRRLFFQPHGAQSRLGLKLKFAAAGEALFQEVQKQTDLDWLRRFLTRIESAGSVEELQKLLPGF